MIYSLELEKQILSGLLQYPQRYVDISPFISETDFSKTHKTIFFVIAALISERGTANSTIAIERLKQLNITLPDLDISQYIESLSLVQISPNDLVEIAKELKMVSTRREIAESAFEIQKKMKEGGFISFDDVIKTADDIYSGKINVYTQDQGVLNLCADIEKLMELSEKQEYEELICPYPAYQKHYGGFRKGNVYCFASRSGQGKSTVLIDLAYKTSNIANNNVKTLYLDTEMQGSEQWPRLLASLSGVPEYFIRTNKYRSNLDFCQRIEKAISVMKKQNFFYKHVGNMPLPALISLIKRWYLKECGRGEHALIIYDYLKILEVDRSSGGKEYELMGDKMDALKTTATELNAPLLTAVQINRSGVNTNRSASLVVDDESVISISDRIQWFTSYMGIFRRKVPEEIQQDGLARGTHKLITLKTRFQGEFGAGHHDLVKVVDKAANKIKYVPNFINFDVSNFQVKECGALKDYVNQQGHVLVGDTGEKTVEI